MKTKLLSAFILSGFVFSSMAQQAVIKADIPNVTSKKVILSPEIKNKLSKINQYNKTNGVESVWINYGAAMDAYLGGTGMGHSVPLCTDSLMVFPYSNGNFSISVHEFGDVLDIKSPKFETSTVFTGGFSSQLNKFSAYSIDSIGIEYFYDRTLASSVVDTLIVYLYSDASAATNLTKQSIWNTSGSFLHDNFGADTVRYMQMNYSYATNKPTATGMITMKIPLTDADTGTADPVFKYIAVNNGTPFTVAANKLVACAYTFKPGYSYALGDDFTTKNAFYGISMEESDQAFPIYNYCNKTFSNCDFNGSGIINTSLRYNIAGSWNGVYFPVFFFEAAYVLEHHAIWYKVTSNTVGINEQAFVNGIKLVQNQPNPFDKTSLIGYEIANPSNVTLSVYDITGKRVMYVEEGKKIAGKHSIEINAEKLHSGIYFYTLTAGDNSLTKKMTVME
jgi:hypothetical protein